MEILHVFSLIKKRYCRTDGKERKCVLDILTMKGVNM